MNWYKIAQLIDGKEEWEMTQSEFLSYHYTGGIISNAYEMYDSVEILKERGFLNKEDHPIPYSTKQFGPHLIEFRKTGEKLKYVKYDDKGNIARDEKGNALYMSEEEIKSKNIALEDQSIVAYYEESPIGWASNEFGATGIYVVKEYRGLGIGGYLLQEFRKTMKPESKMGQMTDSGIMLTRKYHKNIVQQALQEGKQVPEEVLKDYPDLIDPKHRPLSTEETYNLMTERRREESRKQEDQNELV